jgi:hypothetical protein
MTTPCKCTKCSTLLTEDKDECTICHDLYCDVCSVDSLNGLDIDILFDENNIDEKDAKTICSYCFDPTVDDEANTEKRYHLPQEGELFCHKCFSQVKKRMMKLIDEQVEAKAKKEKRKVKKAEFEFCLRCSAKAEKRLAMMHENIDSVLSTAGGFVNLSKAGPFDKLDFCDDCETKFGDIINQLTDKIDTLVDEIKTKVEDECFNQIDRKQKKEETKALEPPKKKKKLSHSK